MEQSSKNVTAPKEAGIDFKPIIEFAEENNTEETNKYNIPPIQRGLVWKPRQIEMLWDSILCQFPIGVFTLIQEDNSENFNLYDGQQRLNAIQIGFDAKPLCDKPNEILWLDLKFDRGNDPSRYFGFRLTTKAHPWGYRLDGSAYSSADRRIAIDEAIKLMPTNEENKENWDIRCFKPIGADCPIPFAAITLALKNVDSCDDFIQNVERNLENYPTKIFTENHREQLSQLFNTLKRVKDYTLILKKIIITKKTDNQEKENDKTLLEVFFNRINTGGTVISDSELAYSAIKHYWGDNDFVGKVREIAKDKIPEHVFAQLLFRFYCSDKNIRGIVKANDIRILRMNEVLYKEINDGLRENIVSSIVSQVEKWLTHNNISSCYYTEVAHNCPELFILLMKFAQVEDSLNNDLDDFMCSMSLYLYFFCNNRVEAIRYLYKNLWAQDIKINQIFLKEKLADCISFGWSHPIPSTEDVDKFKESCLENIGTEWNIWNYRQEKYGEHICQMFSYDNKYRQLSMLRIIEREAFNEYFSNYNPVCKNLWEDLNRPWDNDHIIPKSWIKSGKYKDVCARLVNSIGNIALIPFEENRSKNNGADWTFYEKNLELFHLESFDKFKEESAKDKITEDNILFKEFAEKTLNRFFKIYTDFIKLLEPIKSEELSYYQQLRKNFLKTVSAQEYYYVVGEKEYPITDNFGWKQPWISAKIGDVEDDKDKSYYSLTLGLIGEQLTIEMGKRKNPAKNIADTTYKGWWERKSYNYKKYNLSNWSRNEEIYHWIILHFLKPEYINDPKNFGDKWIEKINDDFEIHIILKDKQDSLMIGLRHSPFDNRNHVSPLNEKYNLLRDFIANNKFSSHDYWNAFKYFKDYTDTEETTEKIVEHIWNDITEMIRIIEYCDSKK